MVDEMPRDSTNSQFHDFLWVTDLAKFKYTYNINFTVVFLSLVAFLELLDAGKEKDNEL